MLADAQQTRTRRHPAAPLTTTAAPPVLAPFSTRLPPDLLERLRVAAPQMARRQGEIVALAVDQYLRERGH